MTASVTSEISRLTSMRWIISTRIKMCICSPRQTTCAAARMCSRRCSTLCFNDPGGWFSRAPIDRKLNRIAGHAALSRRFFIEPVVISAVHIYMKLQEKISFLLSLDKQVLDEHLLFQRRLCRQVRPLIQQQNAVSV